MGFLVVLENNGGEPTVADFAGSCIIRALLVFIYLWIGTGYKKVG
jgi:hypothetical protein